MSDTLDDDDAGDAGPSPLTSAESAHDDRHLSMPPATYRPAAARDRPAPADFATDPATDFATGFAPDPATDAAADADAPDWLSYRRPLTARERAVLDLVAQGLHNREVGDRLGITLGTVKVHMKRVLSKLDARTRTEAAVRYLSGGRDLGPAAAADGAAGAVGADAAEAAEGAEGAEGAAPAARSPAADPGSAAARYLGGGRVLDTHSARDTGRGPDADDVQ